MSFFENRSGAALWLLGSPRATGLARTGIADHTRLAVDTTGSGEYWMTEVGAHEASAGPYGTFDQSGNVWEWNETRGGNERSLLGGSFLNEAYILSASFGGNGDPSGENTVIGFRLASSAAPAVIPEPGTMSLFGVAVAAVLRTKKRRA